MTLETQPNKANIGMRHYYETPHDLNAAIEKAVSETEVVLDIGCGIVPMNYFRPKLHLMVEPWKEYSDILSYRYHGDKSAVILRTGGLEALQMMADNSVDSIFLLDVIEHLEKEDGQKIIIECERVAREQVVIFTPLGFMPQHVEHGQKDGWGLGGASMQEHRSGWEPEDFSDEWTFYICEKFHTHDFKNEPLEEAYGAFYAVRNFDNKMIVAPQTMSDIRRQLPSEREVDSLKAENDALKEQMNIIAGQLQEVQGEVEVLKKSKSAFAPLVSIIIPVYNGANYMRIAIDSALSQTYTNIEVIVVNDGSRDEGATDKIAQSYGQRIRYFSKPNGGCASALNVGIAQMKGEYFSWLSHDDVYKPEKIAHQIEVLSSLSNKDTILYSGYELIDSFSRPKGMMKPESVLPPDKLNISLLPLLRGLIHGCSLLIPKRYFTEIGVFDETLPTTQDYALWFTFFRVAPIRFSSQIHVLSRVHPEQGTHKILGHIKECNELWSGFLRELSEAEMCAMEGSRYRFLSLTAKFLATTPYAEAMNLAQEMAEAALAATKVSVVIPFFNRVDLTMYAIRSVQAQSHPEWEILLVDDGSTDDIRALIEFIALDSRIQYLRQENSGPAKARNYGVSIATGEFIAFLDSDDWFVPEKLTTQLRFMQDNDHVFSHTSYQRVSFNDTDGEFMPSGEFQGNVFPNIIRGCPIAMPTVMGRAELFKQNPFPEHIRIGEDVCLWITLASQHPIGGISQTLSKVRVDVNSASLDKRQQSIGLTNIASFVIANPNWAQHEFQVHCLFVMAARLFSDQETDAVDSSNAYIAPLRSSSLLEKLYVSLRDTGLLNTLYRVYKKLCYHRIG